MSTITISASSIHPQIVPADSFEIVYSIACDACCQVGEPVSIEIDGNAIVVVTVDEARAHRAVVARREVAAQRYAASLAARQEWEAVVAAADKAAAKREEEQRRPSV